MWSYRVIGVSLTELSSVVVLHLGLKVQDVLGEDLLLRDWLFESLKQYPRIHQNWVKLSFQASQKKKVFSYLGKKLIKILRTCRFIPFKFHCKFKKLNTVIHFFIAKLQGTSNWDFVYMSLQIPDYLIKHVKIMWLEQLSLEAYLMCPCFTEHACPWLCDLLSTRLGSLGRLEAWDTVSV